ncbi:hypothetical protein MAPG_04654 [Magnaporthiopsis poae ATCC 64411]|uniref:Carrier domain-containing protein n=1 Tax=Magnaporthiopsis poae (strain ATCC 64411 / 73-15) TaxID=644358 RepID=A0A0C4DXB3_MAGP6|nr:hypothetical protein MAPG_04654 [Magnaporthiopsis poae ATCC 64411]
MDYSRPLPSPKPQLPRINTTNSWDATDVIREEPLRSKLIWAIAHVLHLDASAIQVMDSFQDLGGDQRTATLLRRNCRSLGLDVRTKDILSCVTIAELETCIKPCRRDDTLTPADASAPSNPLQLRSHKPSRLSYASDASTLHSRNSSTSSAVLSPRPVEIDVDKLIADDKAVERSVIIKPLAGPFDGKGVAFLVLRGIEIPESPASDVEVIPQTHMFLAGTKVAAIRRSLEKAASGRELPAVWIVLRKMPTTETGDVNKRRLRTWIQNVNDETQQQIMSMDIEEAVEEPLTDIEKALQGAVSRALRMPIENVGMNFSFAQLGGDDISATQLVAMAKADSIFLNSSEVLQNHTLAQLARIASTRVEPSRRWDGTPLNSGVELSPMQNLYFLTAMGGDSTHRSVRDGSYRFNQSILLRTSRNFGLDDVSAAVDAVVGHHAMLRSRFSRASTGAWTQRVVPPGAGSYSLRFHTVSTDKEVQAIIEESQTLVDIEQGPVFVVDHVQTNDGHQMLYMVAHHLVVDLLSWRVIIQDLDELLVNGSLLSKRSLAFQQWNQLQKREIEQTDISSPIPTGTAAGNYAYWGLQDVPNTYADAREASFCLSPELTTILQTTCNAVFRTESVDIYLAALLLSFSQTFHDRHVPVIWNQEHGRDVADPTIDITDTVGWFTSLSPIGSVLEPGRNDLLDVLRRLKDLRRAMPRRGAQYFASKFFNRDGPDLFTEDWPIELIFSHAGSMQQLERENGVLEQLTIPGRTLASKTSDIGPRVGRIALFEVNTVISRGSAKIKLLYNRQSRHQELIAQWVENFEHLLLEAIGRLRYHAPELTLADVPQLDVTYAGLEKLNKDRLASLGLHSVRDIEAVYPVTAVQQAILTRQESVPESSQLHGIYELTSAAGESVDVSRLCAAWQNVTMKHAALRTVFIESVTETGVYDQVVLHKCSPHMLFIDVHAGEDPIEALNNLPMVAGGTSRPQHRFAVCKAPTKTLVKLDINEALCDAQSMNVIFVDVRRAYALNGPLQDATGLTYPEYLKFLETVRTSQSLDFWMHRLKDVEPCTFPRLVLLTNEQRFYENSHFDLQIDANTFMNFARANQVSGDAVLRLAWGLVLRAFVGSDKVCFGYRATGREAVSGGLNMRNAVGCFGNTIVCNMELSPFKSLSSVLKTTESEYVASLRHLYVSIPELHHVLGIRGHERFFNSCVSLSHEPAELNSRAAAPTNFELRGVSHRETSSFDLAVNARFMHGSLVVDIASNSLLSEREARNVSNTLKQALKAILEMPSGSIESVDLFTDHDYAQVVAWANERDTPRPRSAVVHELVEKNVRETPQATAIRAWDGELTYYQLDDLASRLALRLIDAGVGHRDTVPLVLEKSFWSPVAMLAVLKTGAAFVPIDASDMGFIQPIFEQLNSSHVAIQSQNASAVLGNLFEKVIVLNADLFRELQLQQMRPIVTHTSEEDIACVFFVPASSRQVKGIAFSHASMSMSLLTQGPAAMISATSRVMQLSSYNVDIALSEVFATLIHGGCVCIPTDSERVLDFTGAVQRMEVNWSYMTPLLSRKLNVDILPTLKTVCFRTRSLDEDSYAPWAGKKRVLFAYGAPDICPLGISFLEVFGPHQLNRIGGPLAGNFWIVNPDDHRRLMPVGAVGELVIEGPTLGCDFRNGQADQTHGSAAVFSPGGSSQKTRYFKTGHRVRYTEGGFIQIISSKKEDLEIGGHTIVVSELEQHIRRGLGLGIDVITEAIAFKGAQQAEPVLTAFVELGEMFDGPEDLRQLSRTTRERLFAARRLAETGLRNAVPSYMIPQIYIPVKHLPVTASLKVNRRKLQKIIHGLSKEQLVALSTVPNPGEVQRYCMQPSPLNQMEERMRQIWAHVLNIEDETAINSGDGFIKAGGDDILATKLIVCCRQEGIIISIADVLRNTTLSELCKTVKFADDPQQVHAQAHASSHTPQTSSHTPQTSMSSVVTVPAATTYHEDTQTQQQQQQQQQKPQIHQQQHSRNSIAMVPAVVDPSQEPRRGSNGDDLESVLANKIGVDRATVREVAEASSMQARFIESGMLRGRANINYFVFSFSGTVNYKKLEDACQTLVTIHPVLRTAFVPHKRRMYQIVFKSSAGASFKRYLCPSWRLSAFAEKVIKKDQGAPLAFASPMTKFILLDGGKQSTLLLRLSKAQYDDLSVALLVKDLKKLYDGAENPPRRPSYVEFVRSAQAANSRGAPDYWRSLLEGASMTKVVQHARPYQLTNHSKTIKQRLTVGSLAHLEISFETVIKSAWAMTLASLSGSGDVVFGEVVDGRQIRLSGGQSVAGVLGPTANAIPVRVKFPDQQIAPLDLLKSVQAQRVAGIQFENFGFLDLVQSCTTWPYWTRLSTVVHHQYEETTVVPSEAKIFNLGKGGAGPSCRFTIIESRAQDVPDMYVHTLARGGGGSGSGSHTNNVEVCITFCESRIPVSFAEETLRVLVENVATFTSASITAPLVPSSSDFQKLKAQIPLPQAPSTPSMAAVDLYAAPNGDIAPNHAAAIRKAVERAWTSASLNPATLNVPEEHRDHAAFYDLWGSLIPASQLASALNREVPKLGLPGIGGPGDFSISMEEVLDNPTIARQFNFIARKMAGHGSSSGGSGSSSSNGHKRNGSLSSSHHAISLPRPSIVSKIASKIKGHDQAPQMPPTPSLFVDDSRTTAESVRTPSRSGRDGVPDDAVSPDTPPTTSARYFERAHRRGDSTAVTPQVTRTPRHFRSFSRN